MNHYTLLQRKLFFLIPLLGLLAYSQATAQVSVHLQMNKKSYVVGEPITATLNITNRSGRRLVLSNNQVSSWLNFEISNSGRSIPPARKVNYKSAVIPAGQSIARSVNVSTAYAIGRFGNYTCSASVRLPGSTINGTSSNRVHFTVGKGRAVWRERAGLHKSPKQIREYGLVTFNGNGGLELYAEVKSKNTGLSIATVPLGKVINFRNPTASIDRQSNMHALYQVKPDLFTHVKISPNGRILSSSHHKRGRLGAPRLTTFTSGEVVVAGSVPFDPKKAAADRRKIHPISERPPILFK